MIALGVWQSARAMKRARVALYRGNPPNRARPSPNRSVRDAMFGNHRDCSTSLVANEGARTREIGRGHAASAPALKGRAPIDLVSPGPSFKPAGPAGCRGRITTETVRRANLEGFGRAGAVTDDGRGTCGTRSRDRNRLAGRCDTSQHAVQCSFRRGALVIYLWPFSRLRSRDPGLSAQLNASPRPDARHRPDAGCASGRLGCTRGRSRYEARQGGLQICSSKVSRRRGRDARAIARRSGVGGT